MNLSVLVVGASGRLGRVLCPWLESSSEFELVARVGRDDDLVRTLEAHRGVLGLELTIAGQGFDHAVAMLRAGVRPVVGTSGVSAEQVGELNALALELDLGGIVVPNFSLGMANLQESAERIAASGFDSIEIIETHHPEKRDSPSGTALDTQRRLRAVRDDRPVSIESLRVADAPATQTIRFHTAGEQLELTHRALSREAYLPGVRAALLFAATATGVAHGLRAAIGASLAGE